MHKPIQRPPRQDRTPASEVLWLLSSLGELFADACPEMSSEAPFTDRVLAMMASHQTGDNAVDEMLANPIEDIGLHDVILVSAAFAIEAQAAANAGRSDLAWALLAEGMVWYGGATRGEGGSDAGSIAAVLGRAGGTARHAQTNQMKDRVKIWCEGKLDEYDSLNSMATDAVTAHEGAVYSTVRDWLKPWAKEWRAAGKWQR